MLFPSDLQILEQQLPFYHELTQSQKELLIKNSVVTNFKKGQIIHSGQSNCIGVFYIKNGKIRAYVTSEEGREITLFRLIEDDICLFSATCALKNLDFDICVSAEIACEVILINAPTYLKLTRENVQVELFSYKHVMEYFSQVMWAFQQIVFTSFDKRLAHFLITESNKNDNLCIYMTQEEIAKHLGSAREVVSRMLKYFSTEGYVSLFRGGICIEDKVRLQGLLK